MKKIIYGLLGMALVGGGLVWLNSESTSTTRTQDTFDRSDNPTIERSFTESGDYDCSDFSSWKEAQDFFESEGGPRTDYHNLDRDGDAVACESLKK